MAFPQPMFPSDAPPRGDDPKFENHCSRLSNAYDIGECLHVNSKGIMKLTESQHFGESVGWFVQISLFTNGGSTNKVNISGTGYLTAQSRKQIST